MSDMLNFDSLLSRVPGKPAYAGSWASIYLEPMIASGERLTVAIAAVADDGEIKVSPAIRPHVLEAMFGQRASAFSSLIEMIARDLELHLRRAHKFEGWFPPVSGITVSDPRRAASRDMAGLLRQAVSMTASLAALDLEVKQEDPPGTILVPADDRWPKQFETEVVRRDSRLERFFNQKFVISEPSKPLSFFFLSEKVAMNTGRLIPGRGLSSYLEHNKARILDLRVAREKQHLLARNHFELVVFRPSFDDPTYSLKQIDSLKRSINTLEEACDEHRVRVTQVQSAAEAAERLLAVA
ncbi:MULTISPECIES: hypothetical protein [Pseudomonas]|uniref:hypothetical protein n=1 Tax=Pseudomonas TaxID=286 RepID=UPI000F84AC62|nr:MULTISPECIES: hypothetical protein [Pseudomonas]RTY75541.1 hypothetical protein EKA83_15740 [Pseudomonas veronii]